MKKYLFIITILFPTLVFSQKNHPLCDTYQALFISIDEKITSHKEIKAVYLTFKDTLNNTFDLKCYYDFGKLYYSKDDYNNINKKTISTTFTILYKNFKDKDSIYVYEINIYRFFLPFYIEIENMNDPSKSYCYRFTQGSMWIGSSKLEKTIVLAPNYSGWNPK